MLKLCAEANYLKRGENTVRESSFRSRSEWNKTKIVFIPSPSNMITTLKSFYSVRVNALDNMRLYKLQNPWVQNKRSPEHIWSVSVFLNTRVPILVKISNLIVHLHQIGPWPHMNTSEKTWLKLKPFYHACSTIQYNFYFNLFGNR